MDYSDYSIDQVKSRIKNYDETCNLFLSLVQDEETKNKLKSILYDGGYDGYRVSTTIHCKSDPYLEGKKRIAMANLLISNPETFEYFRANGINLFHGTNANALPSIINNGLNSHSKSKEEGIDVITGEASTRYHSERSFVSITDVLDIARGYAGLTPQGGEDLLSFPVFFGMSTADIKKYPTYYIDSDLPEIAVKRGINPEDIKVVCVPSDKVEFVKKLAGESDIQVLPADGFDRRFYYVDDFGEVLINSNNLQGLKDGNVSKKGKSFSLKELKELVSKRNLKEIIASIKKMGVEPKMVGELENDGRKY